MEKILSTWNYSRDSSTSYYSISIIGESKKINGVKVIAKMIFNQKKVI